MTAQSYYRGNKIIYDDELQEWLYKDTNELVKDNHEKYPCGICGEYPTPKGHDACLGTLKDVENACCGHGIVDEAYVIFNGGEKELRGQEAVDYINIQKLIKLVGLEVID